MRKILFTTLILLVSINIFGQRVKIWTNNSVDSVSTEKRVYYLNGLGVDLINKGLYFNNYVEVKTIINNDTLISGYSKYYFVSMGDTLKINNIDVLIKPIYNNFSVATSNKREELYNINKKLIKQNPR